MTTSYEGAPPLVIFTTVAIGGFRGMIADLLWMRIVRLQEEGNVFEMAQLADWITKLEPRFSTVWAFHAWNMAYNISYLFPDAEDRWRWVNNAISLLRDEGLKYNSNNADLYKELGWIYQHKIGYYLDWAHPTYKWKLAQAMTSLFDGARPNYAVGTADPRLRKLEEEYKLKLADMQEIDQKYGPLDWRLPSSHAIYWAYRGRQVTGSLNSLLSCDYMLCQNMAELFRHGYLTLDPQTGLYFTTPLIDLLPRVLQVYEETMQRYPSINYLRLAHANFLGEAVIILFAYNRVLESRYLYQSLTQQYLEPGLAPGFEDYILGNLQRCLDGAPLRDAAALVEGFLVQHYVWAALGDAARANACEVWAERIWARLLETSGILGTTDQWQSAGLAPLDAMRQRACQLAWLDIPNVILGFGPGLILEQTSAAAR